MASVSGMNRGQSPCWPGLASRATGRQRTVGSALTVQSLPSASSQPARSPSRICSRVPPSDQPLPFLVRKVMAIQSVQAPY